MKKTMFGFTATGLLAVAIFFIACQSDVKSDPNYLYKVAPKTGLAAKVKGVEITEEDLIKDIRNEVYEEELKIYEMKKEQLRGVVLKALVDADPQKGTLSQDEFLTKFVYTKGQKPGDKEVEAFIKERQIPQQHITDQLKERVKQYLEVEWKRKAEDAWMGEKTKSDPIEVYFKAPSRPVYKVEAGNSPAKGPASAKVTIIEFSEFQCPFCSKAAQIVKEVEKKYGDKVRIVFKHFPLSFHPHAQKASEAAMCAHEQAPEKFWTMHDEMFADQAKLEEPSLIEKAKKSGLDEAKFKECLTSGKFKAIVEADVKLGESLGIKATPTFFINGQMLSGALPIESFSEVIDAELAK